MVRSFDGVTPGGQTEHVGYRYTRTEEGRGKTVLGFRCRISRRLISGEFWQKKSFVTQLFFIKELEWWSDGRIYYQSYPRRFPYRTYFTHVLVERGGRRGGEIATVVVVFLQGPWMERRHRR